jgi:hypothetical protein
MEWSNEVPKLEKSHSLSIIRTPAKGAISGIVTSEQVIGTWTHYWGGRTVPCEGDNCEACSQAIGKRWHGYVGIYNPKAKKHVIFEFTANAAEPFARFVELSKCLRGCGMKAERNGRRNNSPVSITTWPADLTGIALPSAPDVKKILCTIWGLPSSAAECNGAHAYAELLSVDSILKDRIDGPAKDSRARAKTRT